MFTRRYINGDSPVAAVGFEAAFFAGAFFAGLSRVVTAVARLERPAAAVAEISLPRVLVIVAGGSVAAAAAAFAGVFGFAVPFFGGIVYDLFS